MTTNGIGGVKARGIGGVETQDAPKSASRVADRMPTLPKPSAAIASGDMIARLTALVEETLATRRSLAGDRRAAEEAAQERAEAAQIASLRAEAEQTFAQGLVGGIVSIGASTFSAVGAAHRLDGARFDADSREARLASARAGALEAASAMTEGVGEATKGAYGQAVKNASARAASYEQKASRAARGAQSEAEATRDIDALVDRLTRRLEEILAQQSQTRLALFQRV